MTFPEKTNFSNFFRMDKKLIMNRSWAKLPLASKAILPAIGVFSDIKGLSFPSQKKIAAIVGCTEKTVREGLDGLMGFPGFRIENYITNRGRRAKRYWITSPPIKKGADIRFYRSFFDSGNWSQLSSVGKALYPVILTFSYFDLDCYREITQDERQEAEFFRDGGYEERLCDFVTQKYDVLAGLAGISLRSVFSGIESLEEYSFIKSGKLMKVFTFPIVTFKKNI